MTLADWAPILAAFGALIAAVLAFWSSRRKPSVDDATAQKIKSEIVKEQQETQAVKAKADAKRDRHIVRLEQWGFEMVRPWGRRAATIVDDQNDLLVELAARANIPFEPKQLQPFPEMPQIDDD